MSAVELEHISCKFGEVLAVDDVNLSVQEGEFVTLLGPSGCGKTTTLRMVAGLEQNSGGRISIAGRVVSDAEANFFMPPDRRRLGMVFQSYAIWPHMTVFDNVAYPLRVRRKSKEEIKERVDAALRLVEMTPYAQRPAPALSGGQQQRVAIARALVFEPDVLLLDEPLSNLDAKLRLQMGDEFRSLQKRLGITCLYVTHDQEEAMALSDRIVVMHAGKILQTGAPEEIYQRPATREVAAFFGSPNLLEARVTDATAKADGSFDLAVEGNGWAGQARAGEKFASGQNIYVMIRPENVSLNGAHDDTAGPSVQWQGKVASSIFRGSHRSMVVETPVHRFHIEAPAFGVAGIGENVTLSAPASATWAIQA